MTTPETLAVTAENGALPPAIPTEYIYRLTLEQYHDMIRLGVLGDDDPIELLEGWLVYKMPKKPLHSFVTQYLHDCLVRLLLSGWFVNVQEPITVGSSEPEPDLALIRGRRQDFRERHATAREIGLLIEVSDTTVARDRGMKKRVYARAGIAVYWIVNLVERKVEVYTQPSGPAEEPDYAQRRDYGPGESVPLVLDGREVGTVPVAELFA